jgi:hypothetical protein
MKLYRQEICGVWTKVIEDVMGNLAILRDKFRQGSEAD